MNKQPLPQINKTYNCFDDGKISISRHYLVTIKEIIPFDEIDLATLKIWESAKRDRGVLAKETDYFIKFIGEDNIEGTFVRCNSGSWFGIGTHDCAVINSGRIDFSKTEKEILDSKDDIIEALLKCYIDCLDITEKDHFFTNNFRILSNNMLWELSDLLKSHIEGDDITLYYISKEILRFNIKQELRLFKLKQIL